MNQKEWKILTHGPKENRGHDFFYYRNLAQKILGYKRNSGLTIHHLRNTKEQQDFNDKYYERWGIDFDGKMKYCVLISTEEHKNLHHLSEETKQKISKSVSKSKKKYTPEELLEHKKQQDKRYNDAHKEEKRLYDKQYYQRNKNKIKERSRRYKYKQKNKI